MFLDVILAGFDGANVDIDDFLAFPLVDAGDVGFHDLGIHPDERAEDAERNRIAHQFEAEVFLGHLRERNFVPGDVVALHRVRQLIGGVVEDDEPAGPQLFDVNFDRLEIESHQPVDEVGHPVIGTFAGANDVVRVAAANARREVFVGVNFQTHALEHTCDQIAGRQAAVAGLPAEHDLDIVDDQLGLPAAAVSLRTAKLPGTRCAPPPSTGSLRL